MKRMLLVSVAVLLAAPQATLSAAPSSKARDMRSGLPFAGNQTFSSLDAYLAHLEKRSAMDVPYYRRLPDGRYERMTGRAQQGRRGEIFTRKQLLEKFGFKR